jgi:hypothetical protein
LRYWREASRFSIIFIRLLSEAIPDCAIGAKRFIVHLGPFWSLLVPFWCQSRRSLRCCAAALLRRIDAVVASLLYFICLSEAIRRIVCISVALDGDTGHPCFLSSDTLCFRVYSLAHYERSEADAHSLRLSGARLMLTRSG